jgi:signal transduction histidine kinase
VIASNLTPGALQKLGLVKAVEDLISKVNNEKSPVIDFQVYGMDIEIDDFTAVHCYRIIQELLVNSIKHSNASEILVQMTRQDDQISILVEDDGIGYDVNSIQKGMGTDNILSRVSMLQGEIHTETTPGKGTSTLIHVPLKSTQLRVNT